MPVHLFQSLVEMVEQACGLVNDAFPGLKSSYRFWEFAKQLDTLSNESASFNLFPRPKFSIMVDTSQDISRIKQFSVFIKFHNHNNQTQLHLLSIIPQKTSGTGKNLFDLLKTALADNNLGFTNCVSICTDGDAAMMSQKVGLRHFAQKANPKILWFHCAAHSFQLGMAHTFDDKRIYDFPLIIEVCNSIATYIVGALSRQIEFEDAVRARQRYRVVVE
ncbi:hypothetical protein BLNAU_14664 [Blattamonas nauphoetae]|uniref:DUF4371 domain-containing protein n=1 Tax=Blattamonas nauphoetae TaxID=2049346 RepID=A0ABQ9XD62_9EUKA|nr:hypothetical protein BLNAU_14664 [Blattamonas nauphoetae]